MKKKLRELTPADLQSFPVGCPAVFISDDGAYYIIGKRANPEDLGLSNRVMEGEELVVVSADLLEGSVRTKTKK